MTDIKQEMKDYVGADLLFAQMEEIKALREENAKLTEALIKAESALTYANWDGEFDSSYTAKDVINARDTARAVLAEVTGHAK